MYVVISNTPGYLPEDDDPATFEELGPAREYLREEVERYVEHVEEGEGEPSVTWGGNDASDSFYALVTDESRAHDLGRVFSIEQGEA